MTTVSQLVSKVGIDTSDVTSGLQSFNQTMVQGVGTTTQQAQLKIDSLSERITFQKRQLDLLGQTLTQTARQYGENSVQVQRAQLSYDRLAASITQNERRLPALRQQFDTIGTSANRVASAGEQFSTSFQQGLSGIIGPAALATAAITGVTAAISGAIEVGGEALALREQQNALRAVTGNLAGYQNALATAREQQRLFGGSLKENIDGIQGLAITSKETGASLAELVDLTQRLQLKSPEQGAGGARIGLVEALSEGNTRSLARRFEIPTAALKDLADESKTTEERLQSLDDYLNRIGISSEAAAGRVDESALAYRRLGQAWEELALKSGGELADAYAGAATGLARLFGLINGDPKAVAELKAIISGGGESPLRSLGRLAGITTPEPPSGMGGGGSGSWGAAPTVKERDESEQKQLDSQYERTQTAFTRLRTAETDYQRERGERLADHQRKLADITSDGNARLADIDRRYQQQQRDADQSYLDKRADIQTDLARKLADLETDYTSDQARLRADAADRLLGIDSALAERLIDLRRASAERIADLEAQSAEQAEARNDARAERMRARAERRAELEQQITQRLTDFDQQQLDRRIAAQEQYQDRLESLAERRNDQEAQAQAAAADREQAYQDRLADMAEAAADRSEDRAQRHADRLADIQRQSESKTQQGRITRLTGETFTTEFAGAAGGGSDTARLLAEEDERYRIEQERAARDEQRAREKLERDRARQEQAAQERLAQAEQQYQDELAAAESAYAEQTAKADEKAVRDRARLEAQGVAQIAALEAQAVRAEEMVAKQEAKEDEQRARQIEKERASLAAREADAIADADKQRARVADELASDLAARDAAYQQQRSNATAHANEQLTDAEAAYVAQLTKLQEAHAAQRAETEQATADRIASEADSYARQDEQRALAYQRQIEQLKSALGEQLSEYTRIQLELGDITQREADRRQGIIESQYLAQAKAQKEAFDAFFGSSLFGSGAPERDDWRLNSGPAPGSGPLDLRDQLGEGTANRGGLFIANLTVNGVQDAQSFLVELRRVAINDIRANGGDVDAYWGGG